MPAVIVIGSGLLAASTAFHLTRRDERDVVVIEPSGGPSVTTGWWECAPFSAQFASDALLGLALASRQQLLDFGDQLGEDPGYRTTGRITVAVRASTLQRLLAELALQQACGLIEVMPLDPEHIAWLHPAIDFSGMLGAVLCPTDGTVCPRRMCEGWRRAAECGGVTFTSGPISGLRRDSSGRVAGVVCGDRLIDARAVVNAAGTGVGAVARLASVRLPLATLRAAGLLTPPQDVIVEHAAAVTFADEGFALAPRGRQVRVEPLSPPGEEPIADDPAALATRFAARVPRLAASPLAAASPSDPCYDVTPDRLPIAGEDPRVPGLFHLAGCGAHTASFAPALGELAAAAIAGGAVPLDPSLFALSRFLR